MGFIHTAHGRGKIVEDRTVRGRREFRVAGDCFDIWLPEIKIASDDRDAYDHERSDEEKQYDETHNLAGEPYDDGPSDRQAARYALSPADLDAYRQEISNDYDPKRDHVDPPKPDAPEWHPDHQGVYSHRVAEQGFFDPTAPGDTHGKVDEVYGFGPDQWHDYVDHEDRHGWMDDAADGHQGIDDYFGGPDTQSSAEPMQHRSPGHDDTAWKDSRRHADAGPGANVMEDNSVALPYNPEPQFDPENNHNEGTMQPGGAIVADPDSGGIDADDRLHPADSLDFDRVSESEAGPYPGPSRDLFASQERPAGLSDRYAWDAIPHTADYHNSPVAQFQHDPVAYIHRMATVHESAGLDHETGEWQLLVEGDKQIREAAWNDVRAKAMRLRREGKVSVKDLDTDRIMASVEGDHGTYDVMIAKGSSYSPSYDAGGSQSIDNWHCSCDWGKWAFKRQMTYVGRLCSHGYATYLEMQSRHLNKKTKGRGNPYRVSNEEHHDELDEKVQRGDYWKDPESPELKHLSAADPNVHVQHDNPNDHWEPDQVTYDPMADHTYFEHGDRGIDDLHSHHPNDLEQDFQHRTDQADAYANSDQGDDIPTGIYWASQRQADMLNLYPQSLTPDANEIPKHRVLDEDVDVTKDERETTGPDQIVKAYRRHLLGGEHSFPWDGGQGTANEFFDGDGPNVYQKTLDQVDRRQQDKVPGGQHRAEGSYHHAIFGDTGEAGAKIKQLRELSNKPVEDSLGNMEARNQKIRELVMDLRQNYGVDADQLVARRRYADDAGGQGQASASDPTDLRKDNFSVNDMGALGGGGSGGSGGSGGGAGGFDMSGLMNMGESLIGDLGGGLAGGLGGIGSEISGLAGSLGGMAGGGLGGILGAKDDDDDDDDAFDTDGHEDLQQGFAGSGPSPKFWVSDSQDYVDEHERPRFQDVTDLDGDIIKYTGLSYDQLERTAGSGDGPDNSFGGSGTGYGAPLTGPANDPPQGPHPLTQPGWPVVPAGQGALGGPDSSPTWSNPHPGAPSAPSQAPSAPAQSGPAPVTPGESEPFGPHLAAEAGYLPDPYEDKSFLLSSNDSSDAVRQFQAGADWIMQEASTGVGDANIAEAAQAHLLKAAGRDYTFAEQAALMNERHPLGARNLEELDLAGTHYLGE